MVAPSSTLRPIRTHPHSPAIRPLLGLCHRGAQEIHLFNKLEIELIEPAINNRTSSKDTFRAEIHTYRVGTSEFLLVKSRLLMVSGTHYSHIHHIPTEVEHVSPTFTWHVSLKRQPCPALAWPKSPRSRSISTPRLYRSSGHGPGLVCEMKSTLWWTNIAMENHHF